MAVFFALLTLVGWGVGDIIATIASRRIGNRYLAFISQMLSTFLLALAIPFVGIPDDWPMFFVAVILGLIVSGGTIFYFQALEVGNASLVGAVSGGFIAPVVVFSIFLFGEEVSFAQIVGIILVIMGLFLSSLNFGELKRMKLSKIISDRGIPFALLAMTTWVIFYTLIRIPSEKIGWFWSGYPAFFFWVFMPILGMVKKEKLMKILSERDRLLPIVLFTILITIAQFAYNIGILSGYTSVVAPIAGAYPALFVILAWLIFREPLTKLQGLGIISSLVGILLIAFAPY